jgi:MYXO-CTERM domain-containing protein
MTARALLAASLCAALLGAAPAWANGRFPAAGQVLVDPADGQHLVLRATFGLLRSRDRGASAGWICEAAIGYAGQEDPMMALGGDGALLAGIYEGLAISRDDGCAWSLAGGALAGLSVIDLSVRPQGAHETLVLAAALAGGGDGKPRVFRSLDGAQSFAELPAPLPDDLLALTLDAAPSDPATIYVSGRFGAPDYQAALIRSLDSGESWERLDIAGVKDRLPYIAAIAPDDPQTVYLRLDDQPGDALLVSHDGGAQWTTLFQGKGALLAFALSPDGSELVVGGDKDGVQHSKTAAPAFTQVASIKARCATWAKDGLYVCADPLLDGFALGFSTDGGKTLAPAMQLTAACGALACPAASSVGAHCPGAWAAVAAKIDAKSCAPDAGTSAASSGGSTGGEASGCGCGVAGEPSSMLVSMVTLLVTALARRRRRVSRASPPAPLTCPPSSR